MQSIIYTNKLQTVPLGNLEKFSGFNVTKFTLWKENTAIICYRFLQQKLENIEKTNL